MGNSCCGEQRQIDNEINTVTIKGQPEQKKATPYQSSAPAAEPVKNSENARALANEDLKDLYDRVLKKVANQYR